MTYPLTGSAKSTNGSTIMLPFAQPILEISPTRRIGAIPIPALGPGYQRVSKGVVFAIVQSPSIIKIGAQRQWGLAPTFKVVSDHWGTF